MKKTLILMALLLTGQNLLFSASLSGTGGIYQLIENRNGNISCYGVMIQLNKLSFNRSIANDEISIIESKHNKELKDIMIWKVDKIRKRLIIKFRKGTAGFGTGNVITILIRDSAFTNVQNQSFSFGISTDPL